MFWCMLIYCTTASIFPTIFRFCIFEYVYITSRRVSQKLRAAQRRVQKVHRKRFPSPRIPSLNDQPRFFRKRKKEEDESSGGTLVEEVITDHFTFSRKIEAYKTALRELENQKDRFYNGANFQFVAQDESN